MPGKLAYIFFLEDGVSLPGSPDNTLPGVPDVPDQGLPVPNPPAGQPGHLPSVPPGKPIVPGHPIVRWPARPTDPDYGIEPVPNPPDGQPGHLPSVPPGFPVIPSHPWRPGRPVRPGHRPPWSGRPTDPDYGVDEGEPEDGGDVIEPPMVPPPTVPPGNRLILVYRNGAWHWAVMLIQTGRPDQGGPTPPTAQPKS